MKLAIFGCGKIANRIAASCKLTDNIELVGFGSKDPAKAEEYLGVVLLLLGRLMI